MAVVAAIIGVVVVVAMVFGLIIIGISRNNSTADSTPLPTAYLSAAPTLGQPSSLPTEPPASTTGSITFEPSVLSCSNPVDMVMTTVLPASVNSGDSISETIDGHSTGGGPVTEGGTTTHRADGTWIDVSTSTAESMKSDCARGGLNTSGLEVLTEGSHTLRISDSLGNLLASGSYMVTSAAAPTATPTPVAGSIYFTPSMLSCSAPVDFVTVLSLPASVQDGDTVTETLDGATYGTGTVTSSSWTHLSDGSWTNTTTDTASQITSACSGGDAALVTGTHVVKLLDAHDTVLAESQYTVTP
jgi:hypothetical protein